MKSSVSLLALAVVRLPRRRLHHRRRRAERRGAAARLRRRRRASAAPTAAEADAFVARAERELAEFTVITARAQWVNATYITQDTDALAAHFGTIGTEMGVRFANEAARYQNVPDLSPDTRRKLNILRAGLTLPAPTTRGRRRRAEPHLHRPPVAIWPRPRHDERRAADRQRDRGADGHGPQSRPARARCGRAGTTMSARRCAPQYVRMAEIANAGARELGFADTGAMWRSNYDMTPEEFAALTERLWNEVRPLYEEIHCFTRAGLNRRYGDSVQPATGPIRADLLGNLWAQEWGNIYDVVAPPHPRRRALRPDPAARAAPTTRPSGSSARARAFFSSLGFAPLPQSFWERSMITQPRDREVICHASAWDVDNVEDLRIKMCTRVNADDFITVHHELGHNYYQRAYNQQPFLYLDSANDGFHEAIGDMIALSVTPEYLVQIGLLRQNQLPNAEQDRALLLRQALDKIAFLPFGLLVDRYRWGIFSGQIPPGEYQAAWDRMRLQYQGIVPPVPAHRAAISTRAPNITCRRACPTPATSSPASSSSSSTRRPATSPAGAGRCTAAPSTAIARSAGG